MVISLQFALANLLPLLRGNERANALRNRWDRPESTPVHPANCNSWLEGRLVLGRDPFVPFEQQYKAVMVGWLRHP